MEGESASSGSDRRSTENMVKKLDGVPSSKLILLPSSTPLSSTPAPAVLFPAVIPNMWCDLPTDVGAIVCEYLEVDYCGYMLMISKLWSILPTEALYRRFCYQIFQSQTAKKILNLNNWGGSWRTMLISRPRLRTNGIYSLRTSYSKPPVNDRFWEEKISEFSETKFYRHLRFFDDGRLLYSLCNTSCVETSPLLEHFHPQPGRKVLEGSYQLSKDVVLVRVSCPVPPPHLTSPPGAHSLCRDQIPAPAPQPVRLRRGRLRRLLRRPPQRLATSPALRRHYPPGPHHASAVRVARLLQPALPPLLALALPASEYSSSHLSNNLITSVNSARGGQWIRLLVFDTHIETSPLAALSSS
jgi:hypothetical protein